jgi:hypothetical protein
MGLFEHPGQGVGQRAVPQAVGQLHGHVQSIVDLAQTGRTLLRIGQDPGSFRSATVRGDLVRRLVDRAKYEPGGYAVAWDGRHDSGMSAANGIYFYSLRTEHANLTRRMLLLK